MEEIIPKSKDGKEKYATYSSMLTRYRTAMNNGFFFEALLIDYAVLEDRLESFLWAAAVINDMGVYKFGNKRNKTQLKEIYIAYCGVDKLPRLRNISGKIEMARAIVAFGKSSYDGTDVYMQSLHKALQTISLDKLDGALSSLDAWRNYRNEVIHDAMNKNIFSLYASIEEKAVAGLEYARIIDNEAKKLGRRQYLRRSANMPFKK